MSSSDPKDISESPPTQLETAAVEVATPVEAETTAETKVEPVKSALRTLQVKTACRTDIGHVRVDEDDYGKENDQDYGRTLVIDYPSHGFKIVIVVMADGIGSSTGGERMAQAAVDIFLGAFGARMPAFSAQDSFTERTQFGDRLAAQVAKWFVTIANWMHAVIFKWGTEEYPPTKDKPHRFGCTFVALAAVVDTVTGSVVTDLYWTGDARAYLITNGSIEQLTEDMVRRNRGGELTLEKWVGDGGSANGKHVRRKHQLDPQSLPFLQFLLCTDGLHTQVSPEVIAEVSRKHLMDPETAVDNLIEQAKTNPEPYGRQFLLPTDKPLNPGDDNIGVAIISVYQEGESE